VELIKEVSLSPSIAAVLSGGGSQFGQPILSPACVWGPAQHHERWVGARAALGRLLRGTRDGWGRSQIAFALVWLAGCHPAPHKRLPAGLWGGLVPPRWVAGMWLGLGCSSGASPGVTPWWPPPKWHQCPSSLWSWVAQNHRITESQNDRMVEVGRDLCGPPSPTPCPSRVTQSRMHSTASRQGWNISREGDSTASLGSLGQGSITLRGKKFFLMHGDTRPLAQRIPCSPSLTKLPSPAFSSKIPALLGNGEIPAVG